MPDSVLVDERPLHRLRINFSWIVKLRWAAAAGQFATVLFVAFGLGVRLPLLRLFAVLLFEVISNAVLAGWSRGFFERAGPRAARDGGLVLAAVMATDIVLLTLLLSWTGGPQNPFSVFYLVNVVLAAVVLDASRTWALTALALGGYVLLFMAHVPLPELQAGPEAPGGLPLYFRGLFVAFVTAAVVIVWFVTRLTGERVALENALGDAERRKERAERLEALGTLAAGAAHELASPLSTIAVAAKDLERALQTLPAGEAADDARLIRAEVQRCREILDQMSADVGQTIGEELVPATLAEIVATALERLGGRERVEVRIAADCPSAPCRVPRRALALALRQVVKNALDASPPGAAVDLEARCVGPNLELRVRDRGVGMTPETVARATDPFFTTKEPGKGMGLGLFLTQSMVDRLDGRLVFESAPDVGTTVTMALPCTRLWPERPAAAPAR